MKRVHVSFYDETYNKLETYMNKNKAKSIPHCIRELVDLGLRVTEAAQKSNDKEEGDETLQAINKIQKQLKTNLGWVLETRLLVRYIVENSQSIEDENKSNVLDKYKESAVHYIKGMFDEEDT